MEANVKPEESCMAFDQAFQELDPAKLQRFVVGADVAPTAMEPDEVAAELGDPIAQLVFAQGRFPETPSELLGAIDEAVSAGDPLGRESQLSFCLGEGSQIAMSLETEGLTRSIRFLVTRGGGSDGPDVLVSAPDPDGGFVEAMGWDAGAGGFNFYRTLLGGAWAFGGNSRHAIGEPTGGKGPFESHTGGNLLMKEFRFPWPHWHSFASNIFATVFRDGDPRAEHEWFTEKSGADVCELQVAQPAIERWTRKRFEAVTGEVSDPARILSQLLETPTVNLVSSQTVSGAAAGAGSVDLPSTFFVDQAGLVEVLGLEAPPALSVAAPLYLQALETLEVHLEAPLRGGGTFSQPGDTHFAFVVPERSIEDTAALRSALGAGLVSRRFAACLLMVDFPNPIFSERRAALMAHVPQRAAIEDGASGFSEEMADRIVGAPGNAAGSPEAEFAELWQAGEEGFEALANERLRAYYASLATTLAGQEGFDAVMRLAESRRELVRAMPIFESNLLFATTNVEPAARRMRADATVEEG